MTIAHEPANSLEEESMEGKQPSEVDIARLKNAYKATLAIPAIKRDPQILLCPVGLVGAGKTTVVKPLGERLGLVRVSTDDIRKHLHESDFNYGPARGIAIAITNEFLAAGYSVALDADCAGSARNYIEEAEKKYALKVIWLHINPPEAFILNKLRNYPHTWLFKNSGEAIANYHRRKPLHEKLDMPFLATIDPSKETLPQQIEEVIEKIER